MLDPLLRAERWCDGDLAAGFGRCRCSGDLYCVDERLLLASIVGLLLGLAECFERAGVFCPLMIPETRA